MVAAVATCYLVAVVVLVAGLPVLLAIRLDAVASNTDPMLLHRAPSWCSIALLFVVVLIQQCGMDDTVLLLLIV